MRSLCDAAATAELVKKDLAAAASAPPCLVAEGDKSDPLAPSLSKPGGVFLHCTPSSAIAGAQSCSATAALIATGDGSHVGEDVVQALVEDHVGALVRVNHTGLDYSGNRTATHQPLRFVTSLLEEDYSGNRTATHEPLTCWM